MGLKGFIWIIILTIVVVFILQNLQPISLVFLGSKPITLPTSVWVISFTILGIFSSLMIQGLSNVNKVNNSSVNSSPKNSSYSSKIPPNKPNPPNNKSSQIESEIEFEPSYQDEFDDFPEPLKEEIDIDQNTPVSIKKEEEEIQEITLKDTKIDFNKEEKIKEDNEENKNEQKEEINQDRVASLYSYKPREKTEIKPIVKQNNQIYDANYRVITPPYKNSDRTNSQDDEDNENWEF
jgi:hypothetical protein